ncbi:hypothetical protein [Pseudoxanthomonas beigongshangi]|uniref:hypothetical protein n=1 Tax=Pseudoxanthomonas beigongshangi TaxID=2782537 RepID=UPI00193BD189|nr:hypothetical protein [Pseudoxanthomonas beigongshangi]
MNTRGCFMVQSIASGRIFEVCAGWEAGDGWMSIRSNRRSTQAAGALPVALALPRKIRLSKLSFVV